MHTRIENVASRGCGASIPDFPTFAPLTIGQRESFGHFLKGLPPNFECSHASWYAWNTAGEVRVAQLHGNLVLSWRNAESSHLFYTFLGDREPENTAMAVLKYTSGELRLVPEQAAKALVNPCFHIHEDRDHSDYLFDARALSDFRGNKLQVQRRWVNYFRRNGQARMERLNPSSSMTVDGLIDLIGRWEGNKIRAGKPIVRSTVWGDEIQAMRRLISNDVEFGLVTLGIWSASDELIACSISEVVRPWKMLLVHFLKADTRKYRGSFQTMMQETAKMALGAECELINFGEDMGISSIRDAKLRYRPVGFCKKYTVKRVSVAGSTW